MNLDQCVFCGTTTDLNTSFTISVDDNKVVVKICDIHAEDATVKSAREAYLEKRKAIDALLVQAKALGLQLSEQPSGLVVVSKQPQTQPQTQPQAQPQAQRPVVPNGDNIIPTSKLDRAKFQSVGGVSGNINVQSHTSLDASILSEKLTDDALTGYAEMGVFEGRGGQPIAIPQRRVDKTGVTRITVNKSTDAALQERFKRMAKDAMDDNAPDFVNTGYQQTQKPCPMCRSLGRIKQTKDKEILCPKWNGSGILSIY